MSILIGKDSRVVIQGITGRQASWVLQDIQAYGTNVVGGVVPGRGGATHRGVPVFSRMLDVVSATDANTAFVFVPPRAARDAVSEAIDAGVRLIVYPGDGCPSHDAVIIRRRALEAGVQLVGPNTAGAISPGKAKVGFMPSHCFDRGGLGVISKSGSLSYEVCLRLTKAGLGQSTVVGVGGDPIKGLTMGDCLALFHADLETTSILVLGEIGGTEEYEVVEYAKRGDAKPIVAFIVGRTAPMGEKLGHAGALILGPRETYDAKKHAMQAAGITVVDRLSEICAAALAIGN